MEETTGLTLQKRIYEELDFCHFSNKTRHGLLAHGTTAQIKHEVEEILIEKGLQYRQAQLVTEICWQDCDVSDPVILKAKSDLKDIFQQLKWESIKIAVCTSDSRQSTETSLRNLNLDSYIDRLVCGDDIDSTPKPSGRNIKLICDSLGLQCSDAVMIGDTRVDMEMGRNAGVGLAVGVLSGIGTRLNLAPVSDDVVANVKEALPLIFDRQLWKQKQKQAKQGPQVQSP